MTIYAGSLKYSPVFKSHCCAFGRACEEKGYSVRYLFSREYDWLLPEEVKEKTVFVGHSVSISSMLKDIFSFKNRKKIEKIFLEDKPTHIYMHNYHFLNHYIAKMSKRHGCKFIYHVHEPYVQDKKAHGGFHQYWLYLFEYFQGRLLERTDVAIVSSSEASRLFDLRYPHYSGKKMLIPLMYEDLGNSNLDMQDREYITFVGPPVPAKNPDKFLEIVRYSSDNDLRLKFLLISRSEVRDAEYFRQKNLKVFSKKRISDEEFGELIRKSIAVLTPYKRETQSSVILVSYMYGTPVVSSDVGGLPEFVSHKETGYLLDLKDRVVFTGFVEDEDFHALFSIAEIVVLPYPHSMAASGPLSIAIQHHKPVIATKTLFFNEMLKNGYAVLVKPRDVEDLTNFITKLLENSWIRVTIAKNIATKSHIYSWENIAKKTLECYLDLMLA